MKIIDLLNKIANGEYVPKKVKYGDEIYEYDCECKDYNCENNYLFSDAIENLENDSLNSEVEIIEDNNKIEKIKITDDRKIFNTISNNYNQLTNWGYLLANKINEIIDKLEELDNENSNIR